MPEVVIPNLAIVISDGGSPFYKKAVSLDTAWPTPAPVSTSLRRTFCELDIGTWAGATQSAIHDFTWESASLSDLLCQTRVLKQCSWWKASCAILFYKLLEITQLCSVQWKESVKLHTFHGIWWSYESSQHWSAYSLNSRSSSLQNNTELGRMARPFYISTSWGTLWMHASSVHVGSSPLFSQLHDFWNKFLRVSTIVTVVCLLSSLSRVRLFATPWSVARRAPLSMGTLQARILEWVAMPSSRGSSPPRDRTQVSCTACVFSTTWATRGPHDHV